MNDMFYWCINFISFTFKPLRVKKIRYMIRLFLVFYIMLLVVQTMNVFI